MDEDIKLLHENIHKVKLEKTKKRTVRQARNFEAYKELPSKLALRAFFTKVTGARKESKEPEMKVKYTLFLEPVPFFCRYNEGDEDLTEFQPIFYESFREGRAAFIRLLDIWYKRYRTATTAGAIP